jgi:hypothetical protein
VIKGCVQRQLQERGFAATRQSFTGNSLDAFASIIDTFHKFMDGWIPVESRARVESMKDEDESLIKLYSQNIIPEPEPLTRYERNCQNPGMNPSRFNFNS